MTYRSKLIAAAAIVAICLGGILMTSVLVGKWRQASTAARLSENQKGAALDSGRDAVGSVGAVMGNEAAIDRITRENENAIRNAAGAGDAVNPAVRDAGLASLCRRASYKCSEQCVQFTPAGGMDAGCAGRGSPAR